MESLNEQNQKSLITNMLPPATGTSVLNVGKTERILSMAGGAALWWLSRSFSGSRTTKTVLASLGTALLGRGVTGFCPVNAAVGRNTAHEQAAAMEVKGTYTINKPRREVYDYWRNLENLPNFMDHLIDVSVIDTHRSHWEAQFPGVGKVKWDAYINEDVPGEYISWSTLPGSRIDQAGGVSFVDAPGDRGTILHARIAYRLPAGFAGYFVGKIFNPAVEKLVQLDLRRFKSLMETGDLPANTPRLSTKKGKKGKDRDERFPLAPAQRELEREESLAGGH